MVCTSIGYSKDGERVHYDQRSKEQGNENSSNRKDRGFMESRKGQVANSNPEKRRLSCKESNSDLASCKARDFSRSQYAFPRSTPPLLRNPRGCGMFATPGIVDTFGPLNPLKPSNPPIGFDWFGVL